MANPYDESQFDYVGTPEEQGVLAKEVDPAKKLLMLQQMAAGSIPEASQETVNSANTAAQDVPEELLTPDEKTAKEQYKKLAQAQIQEQAKGVASNQADIEKFQNSPRQLNLQPLYNLSNSWFGGNLGAGYQQPMSEDDRAQKLLALKHNLQSEKKDVTTEQLAMLKNMFPQSAANFGLREDVALSKIPTKFANDPVIKPATLMVNGAKRVQSLIDAARQGKIKGTTQLVEKLNQEAKKLEMGRNDFAEGSQERTNYESGNAKLQSLIQKITSAPRNAKMPALVNQLQDELYIMKQDYVKNIADQAKILSVEYSNPKFQKAQDTAIQNILSTYSAGEQPPVYQDFVPGNTSTKNKHPVDGMTEEEINKALGI